MIIGFKLIGCMITVWERWPWVELGIKFLLGVIVGEEILVVVFIGYAFHLHVLFHCRSLWGELVSLILAHWSLIGKGSGLFSWYGYLNVCLRN
jgi:hypothetical protein